MSLGINLHGDNVQVFEVLWNTTYIVTDQWFDAHSLLPLKQVEKAAHPQEIVQTVCKQLGMNAVKYFDAMNHFKL